MKSSRTRRRLRVATTSSPGDRVGTKGWNYWREVWAAWCPTCRQETMPFPSGCCAFCDTRLEGQSTRGPHDPPIQNGVHFSLPGSKESKSIAVAA